MASSFLAGPEFAATLDAVGAIAYCADVDGTLLRLNSLAEGELGWRSSEVSGKQPATLWHDPAELSASRERNAARLASRENDSVKLSWLELLRTDSGGDRDWTFARRDGSQFRATLILRPILDLDRRPAGYLGTILPARSGLPWNPPRSAPPATESRRSTDRSYDDAIEGVIAHVVRLKRDEERVRLESRVLELLVDDAPLPTILDLIARHVELESPTTLCSILLLSEDGRRLQHGAAPSLPPEYSRAIDGIEIGPLVGSCGSAAYHKHRVVAEDLETHPAWASYRELARLAGVRSCWSEPILAGDGTVLGTFAMYHRTAQSPADDDLDCIEWAAGFTRLSIEKRRRSQRSSQD